MKTYSPMGSKDILELPTKIEENTKLVLDKYNTKAKEIKKEYRNLCESSLDSDSEE